MLSRCVLGVLGFVLLTFYFLLGLCPARHIALCFYIKKMGCTWLISRRNSQQPEGAEGMWFSDPIREMCVGPQASQVRLPQPTMSLIVFWAVC